MPLKIASYCCRVITVLFVQNNLRNEGRYVAQIETKTQSGAEMVIDRKLFMRCVLCFLSVSTVDLV